MQVKKTDKDITLEQKVEAYISKFGDDTIKQLILEKDSGDYFGSKDYVEILYYNKKGEPKRLKILGELMEYVDYTISKINERYEVYLIRVFDGKYYPLEKFEKGEYL